MQEIQNIREEIDQIQKEMAMLFRRRLALARKIWEIKKAENISLIDQNRESIIIHNFDNVIADSDEQKAIQSFFRNMLNETKKFLEIKIK